MAFNFAPLLSAACGGAPRHLGRLRRPWARCARLFWGGYQHRKSAVFFCLGGTHDGVGRVGLGPPVGFFPLFTPEFSQQKKKISAQITMSTLPKSGPEQ